MSLISLFAGIDIVVYIINMVGETILNIKGYN